MMLNNRILVVGLERRALELLNQIRSDFIFIAIDSPRRFNSTIHALEAVIFAGHLLGDMGAVLEEHTGRPVFGLGPRRTAPGVQWLEDVPKPIDLEKLLLESLGTLRAPPRKTGEIEVGTVVKNKTFGSWGPGVVKKALENDLFLVNFPKAQKIVKKEDHVCHKSILRIICSIKELTNEAS